MSIITPAMKKYRDQLAASGSNCKVWFPCDDGEGTTLTDAINGIIETDGSAAHAEPHAISFGKASGAPTSGVYPKLKANALLVLSQKVNTAESFMTLKFGSNTTINVVSGSAGIDYALGPDNGATTPTSALGSVGNDVVTTACAVIGDTIYHYGSINGAGISVNGSADASGYTSQFLTPEDPQMENSSIFSNAAVRQHLYGMALFTFNKDEFTTTEIVAALDEIDGNWPNGKKYLPSSIL